MQTNRIVQAVILMSVVAMAASCTGLKAYSSRLFTPPPAAATDTAALAVRFLEMENMEINPGGWVSTDIINGKDSTGSVRVIDNLARTMPVTGRQPVKSSTKEEADSSRNIPVARSIPGNTGTRNKKSRDEQ